MVTFTGCVPPTVPLVGLSIECKATALLSFEGETTKKRALGRS